MLNQEEDKQRVKKIFWTLLTIIVLLSILIFSIFKTIKNDRRIPTLDITKKELAVRGNIYSSDGFKMTSSKKLYKASIDTRYLDLDKKELFITLFSIYSNISYKRILKKVNKSLKKPGNLVLSYNIDSRSAKNLKELGYKLIQLKVFVSKRVNGNKVLKALDVRESGEKRVYSYENTLTPVVGYIRKYESKNGKTKVKGIKGLEKKFDTILNNTTDGVLSGKRDVLSYITFDKDSTMKQRIDGADLYLNISLKLQKNVEMILDIYKEQLKADEIIVSIMESKTGKVISFASSNRFNPSRILQSDIPSLNVKGIEYPFEPGSVIKPITISLVLDKNRVKKKQLFSAYNKKGKANKKGEYPKGKYKIGRHTIGDDHRFKKHLLTIEDIVVFSSNIGTLQLAQKLSGKEILEGMKSYGFAKRSGIELPYERTGIFPSLKQLSAGESRNEDNVYKATVSYGQGMTSTFMQVLKAYTVFNNEGKISTPRLISHISNNEGNYTQIKKEQKTIISKKTAKTIKDFLVQTVEKGTGRSARIEGLEIGGKTGTAQIAQRGQYQKKYISSFFGFANDKKTSYTIGVTVFNPNSKGRNWYQYYASKSAVPVFKELVNILLQQKYLKIKD
ncbi:peptidoglycan D,D-transpeptidase FtsI family protein [Poseidonibacter antarcticus]|uniref:peptidoglycan D,D-transpeptidase FtsI family protein n=1 Tax=Poseidonibacter antarcticus TaxID=2478538 RepID=UPI001D188EE3|nr:penicillin-binding protein 2 [Poseidonibacter antarcticus]